MTLRLCRPVLLAVVSTSTLPRHPAKGILPLSCPSMPHGDVWPRSGCPCCSVRVQQRGILSFHPRVETRLIFSVPPILGALALFASQAAAISSLSGFYSFPTLLLIFPAFKATFPSAATAGTLNSAFSVAERHRLGCCVSFPSLCPAAQMLRSTAWMQGKHRDGVDAKQREKPCLSPSRCWDGENSVVPRARAQCANFTSRGETASRARTARPRRRHTHSPCAAPVSAASLLKCKHHLFLPSHPSPCPRAERALSLQRHLLHPIPTRSPSTPMQMSLVSRRAY